jgi:hypothetical protein
VWNSKNASTGEYLEEIISTITRKIVAFNSSNNRAAITCIEGFTDLLKPVDENEPEGKFHIYRAHPGYYDGQPWHDWANISWTKPDPSNGNRIRRYTAEGKLHIFLDFSKATYVAKLPRKPTDPQYSRENLTPKGYQALVSSVVDMSQDQSLAWMRTKLSRRLPVSEALDFVSVDNIMAPTFMIEESNDPRTSLPTTVTNYLPMARWGELFLPPDWSDDDLELSQLTNMRQPTTEEIQFVDDENTDAIFLDEATEYL